MKHVDFAQHIGDAKGELKYTVIENSPSDHDIRRDSMNEGKQIVSAIVATDYETNDDAMQALYNLQQRNAARIAATKRKLKTEEREQDALTKVVGKWKPPVEEEV